MTVELQKALFLSGWGSGPTLNDDPSILANPLRSVWQPSYAVDGHTVPPSSVTTAIVCARFGQSAEILGHCWAMLGYEWHLNHTQWLRFKTHNEWSQHPWYAYLRCLYAVDWHMVPPSSVTTVIVFARFGQSAEILGHCWATKCIITQWLRL